MKAGGLLFILLTALASPVRAVQTVEIGTYDVLPPYAYRDEAGQLTGVYIDIVKTAVSRMPDYAVDFHVAPWSRVKSLAQFGKVFAILPPYFHAHDWLTDTEPKRPYLWPYSLPLFEQQDIVICNANSLEGRAYQYPDGFANLLFSRWRGDGRAGEAFEAMVEKKLIKVVDVASIKEAVRLVLFGRYDCTIASRLPYYWYLRQIMQSQEYGEWVQKKNVVLREAAVISRNAGYLAYSDMNPEKFPFKKDFAIKFDIEIHKMKQSGEIDRIVQRFTQSAAFQNTAN